MDKGAFRESCAIKVKINLCLCIELFGSKSFFLLLEMPELGMLVFTLTPGSVMDDGEPEPV